MAREAAKRAVSVWLDRVIRHKLSRFDGMTLTREVKKEIGDVVEAEIEFNRYWVEDLLGEELLNFTYDLDTTKKRVD